MKSILLNPGPVTLSDGVRRAVTGTDLCHREPEFFDLQDQVIKALLAIYQCDAEDWSAVLLGGSGTSAMEAMMVSLLPAGARVLVLENGVYGERLREIAEIYGLDHESLKFGWEAALDLKALAKMLSTRKFTHVFAVHHETTTGRLNPVEDIATLCAEHSAHLMLDAVSSFGAEAIAFEHQALQAVAATANKCLHGIPGLAMVLCRNSALQQENQQRSLSLHLPTWARHQHHRSTPFTPAINALSGLAEALGELHRQGGWMARRTRYLKLASRVAEVLERVGVKPWLPAAESSSVLRSYHLPEGMSYEALHDGLKQHGFVIYAGQGHLANRLFRISTMGEISDEDMKRLEQAIQSVLAG